MAVNVTAVKLRRDSATWPPAPSPDARRARPDVRELQLADQPRRLLPAAMRRAAKVAWAFFNRPRYGAIGRHAWIRRPMLIVGARGIFLGDGVDIWPHARIEALTTTEGLARIEIGSGTIMQPFFQMSAAAEVRIGRNCLFASHVFITDHDHDWRDPACPITRSRGLLAQPVTIGDSVWLGQRVVVLKGVEIGTGAVVASGSVVTRDVAPHTIVAGSPARAVSRYDAATGTWQRVARR